MAVRWLPCRSKKVCKDSDARILREFGYTGGRRKRQPPAVVCNAVSVWRVEFAYPNNSITAVPVVNDREIPLASCGSLIGMSSAW